MRTLLDACAWAGIAPPRTYDELRKALMTLHRRGVRHNVESEPFAIEAIREERAREREIVGEAIRKARGR